MAETKTKPTGASVDDYIESRANDEQRKDCKALMAMMKRITGEKPKMWGPSMVGHGMFRYTYETGHTGETALAAFAIRGRALVVYIYADTADQQRLLTRLGPHKMGKSCLYFKRLADLDVGVLEQLVANSVREAKSRYPANR